MLRLLFELLILYLIYKLVRWMLSPPRPTVGGRGPNPEIREEDIQDAEYREIKD